MARVVELAAPGRVGLVEEPVGELTAGRVRVRTHYSGISAGTELTAYRGTNPYLHRRWDADRRLFVDGEPTFGYPVTGWGYQEVGEVTGLGDGVDGLAVGDRVYGIWGHRSEAVVPVALVTRVPDGVDTVHATFARVGAIALNAVLASGCVLGDRVAIFGQGVIGLLATRLATLSGADVIAVDAVDHRRGLAAQQGAWRTLGVDEGDGAAASIRDLTGAGADAAIELSGSHAALAEAIRCVAPDAVVAAAGFYQGDAGALRLGEEFHHNRVRLVASQIGGTPLDLGPRWHHRRLNEVVMSRVASGALDVAPLLTHVLAAERVADAFELLDRGDGRALQVVLDFRGSA